MTLEDHNSNAKTPNLTKKPCMLLVDDNHERLSLVQDVFGGHYEF